MKKGVTISILTITIVIMFIIIGVTTYVGTNSIKTVMYEEFMSKVSRVSDNVNEYLIKNKSLPITSQIISKEGLSDAFRQELSKKGDSNNNLYVIDMDKINVESVNIGFGNVENLDVFVVAENTNNIYYLKGIKYKNVTYYGVRITTDEMIEDTLNPSATITLSANQTTAKSAVTAKVVQSDTESGINLSECRWTYTTTSTNLGLDKTNYTATFVSIDETLILNTNVAGEYYLHVLTVDRFGNKIETISSKVTVY